MTTPLIWPTTPLQRGLIAARTPYIGQARISVDGLLDPHRFAAAVATLHETYPQLNAGFFVDADVEPTQFVTPIDPHLQLTHTTPGLCDADFALVVDEAATADAGVPFDLTDPPLLRWHLLTGGDRGCIVVTAHHSVLDAWSMPLLMTELARLASDQQTPAPAVCDYAEHLALLHSADREAAAEHWRTALSHLHETSVPRWSHRAEPHEQHRGKSSRRVEAVLAGSLTAKLAERVQREGLTLAGALRGCVSLAIDWVSGTTGTPFVTPVHGRDPRLPGVQNTPGLFTDSVLFAHPASPGTVGEALAELDAAWNAGLPHQHIGLAGILQSLALRDPARVLYSHEVDAGPVIAEITRASGSAVLTLTRVEDDTHYPMEITSIHSVPASGDPSVILRVTVDERVHRRAAERLLHALVTVVMAFATDPMVPLSALDLRTPLDREMLEDRLSSATDTSAAPLLPEAFAAACLDHPDQLALVTDDRAYTFAELATEVNLRRLALREATTRSAAARPLIVLHLPRTAAAVTTLLASLVAGFTTLVIDPSTPPQRRAEILDDLNADVLVDADGIRGLRDSGAGHGLEHHRDDSLPVSADDTAFLVLTSGSTGKPKPVAVSNRAMAALLAHHREHLWGEDVRVLAHTNALHFDAHWDALLGLFDGRTVRLVQTHTLLDPHALATLLETERIDYLDLGPMVWSSHLAAGLLGRLPAVCVAGGEAFPPDLWTLLRERAAAQRVPDRAAPRVLNLYGPTENAVDALMAEVADSSEPRVGYPVGGTSAQVLDDWLRPVAPGIEGELYLGGSQLALGYAGRAAMTAERFVAAADGARLYRTGDRAWVDETGSVALLGRADDQISINGFRIEPGEVVRALTNLAEVAQAHVAAIPHPRGGKRLVAWAVPAAAPQPPEPAAVRTALSRMLPPHLVPAAVLLVPEFTVTSNGKLDTRELPRPDWALPTAGSTERADGNDAVRAVVDAAVHVLGVADEGASLLALGGDSISAIRVSAALRRAGWAMAPGVLLTANSLAEAALQAGPIEPEPAAPGESAPVAVELPGLVRTLADDGVAVQHALGLTGTLAGIYVTSLRDADDDPYRTATLLRLDGLHADVSTQHALERAWAEVEAAHPVLRTIAAHGSGDLPSAYVMARGRSIHRVISGVGGTQTELDRLRRDALALAIDEQDLASGRLVVLVWLRLRDSSGAERIELALGLHHLLADGWSTPLIADALTRALSGQTLAHEHGWIDYLRWLAAQDHRAWEAVWRDRFADASVQTLLAPQERAVPHAQSRRRVRATWHPTAETDAAHARAARGANITRATAVIAAWARTLAAITARAQVVFGVTASGRDAPVTGIDKALGAFLTTSPLGVDTTASDAALCTAIARDLAPSGYEAHLGAVGIARAIGRRYDSLVVIEAEPAGESAPAPAGPLVTPLRGQDASGFPVTLTLAHTSDGPAYEVELDHPHAQSDDARALVEEFVRRLDEMLGRPGSDGRLAIDAEHFAATVGGAAEHSEARTATGEAEVTRTVQRVMTDVLQTPGEIEADDDFFALGGDSLLVMHLVGALRRAGLEARVADVFTHRSPAALAGTVVPLVDVHQDLSIEATPYDEPVPLTPALRWYTRHLGDTTDPFVQVRALRIPAEITSDALHEGLRALVSRHDALRLRLCGGIARIAEANDHSRLLIDLAPMGDEAAVLGAIRHAATALDPATGALLVAVRTAPSQLVLVAHHLGVDAVSWAILIAELRSLIEGEPLPAAVSFRAAAQALAGAAREAEPRVEGLAQIIERLDRADGRAPAHDEPLMAVGRAHTRTVHLDVPLSRALLALAGEELPLETLLAAATVRALGRPLTVEFEGHGRPLAATGDARDAVELTAAVGWFTSTWSLTLPASIPSAHDPAREAADHLAACAVRAAGLRPFADLLGLCDASRAQRPDLLVNYLGREGVARREGTPDWDVVLDSAKLEDALGLGRTLPASHPWELNAALSDEQIVLHWQCADASLDEHTFHAHLARVTAALRDFVASPHAVAGAAPLDLVGLPAHRLADLRADGVDGVWPLTAAQTGIALESLADPHGHYLTRTDLALRGALDPDALVRAAARLSAQHPALRMRLAQEGDRHVLLSAMTAAPEVRMFDDLALAEAWASEPVDLLTGPLLRWAVVREHADRHRLVFFDHHLVLDGWSVPRVIDGLFAAYRAELAGRLDPASPRTHDSDLAAQVLAAIAQAPTDADAFSVWERVLPHAQGELFSSLSAAHASVAIPLNADLDAAATAHSLTRAEAITLAWMAALSALTGERTLLSGQVVSGRTPNTTDTIGMLLHTVPVAADFAAVDLARTCEMLNATTRLAQTQPWAPLTALARARARTVLFDTLLVVQNYPTNDDTQPAPGLTITGIEGADDTHYPLALTVELPDPGSTGGELRLDYIAGLLSDAAATSILHAVEAAVEALATLSAQSSPSVLIAVVRAALSPATDDLAAAARAAVEVSTTTASVGGALQLVTDALTDVLGLVPAPDEDFFALGGDSLSAMSLVTAVRARGGELTPAMVFAHPTAAGMARVLRIAADTPPAAPRPGVASIALDAAGADALSALMAGMGNP